MVFNKEQRGNVARSAVTLGLGLAMAFGSAVPAFADTTDADAGKIDTPVVGEYSGTEYEDQVSGTSTGDTKLYIIGKQGENDLTTSEGAVDENIKVSIPVAIHYVADSEGKLVGPSDDVVKFVNHTKLGPVHVSKIAVQNGTSGQIRKAADVGTTNDFMSFNVKPIQGQADENGDVTARKDFAVGAPQAAMGALYQGNQDNYPDGGVDELGNYVQSINHATGERGGYTAKGNDPHDDSTSNATGSPTGIGTWIDPVDKTAWNIAQKEGALILNKLDGTIGGFGAIDPSTDYQAGTVHWMVRAGTRQKADVKDTTMTLHFNSNNGYNKNCAPVGDQKMTVLSYNSEKQGYEALPDASLQQILIERGADNVTAPNTVTNADGTKTTYTFQGWSLTNNGGTGTLLHNAKEVINAVIDSDQYPQITNAAQAGNSVIELYAIYTSVTE